MSIKAQHTCVVGRAHLGPAQGVLVPLGVPKVGQLQQALALVQQRVLQLDVPAAGQASCDSGRLVVQPL